MFFDFDIIKMIDLLFVFDCFKERKVNKVLFCDENVFNILEWIYFFESLLKKFYFDFRVLKIKNEFIFLK